MPESTWGAVWTGIADLTDARVLRASPKPLLYDVFAEVQPPLGGLWSRSEVGIAQAIEQELRHA